MVFESSSGIENNKIVQLVLVIILIAAAATFFLYSRSNFPPKNAVDGVYRSGCCRDIIIRDGRLHYGSAELDIELRNTKFGLTGYVDGQFTSGGVRASNEATAIAFFNQGAQRTLSLPIDRQDQVFRMEESRSGGEAR